MSVRLHPAAAGSDRLHYWRGNQRTDDGPGGDVRVTWTACGIRFAWGTIPRRAGILPRCPECFA